MFDEQPDDDSFDAVIRNYAAACMHGNAAGMREGYIKLREMCEGGSKAADSLSTPSHPYPSDEKEHSAGAEPVHLIVYDDHDVRPEIFAGSGATAAAHARFKAISAQWNAHLFVKLKSNTRDDPYANDNATLALGAEAVEALRSALAELVALKDLKDKGIPDAAWKASMTPFLQATADYERRLPLAWAAARAALSPKEQS